VAGEQRRLSENSIVRGVEGSGCSEVTAWRSDRLLFGNLGKFYNREPPLERDREQSFRCWNIHLTDSHSAVVLSEVK
jgi:hypothetical protein